LINKYIFSWDIVLLPKINMLVLASVYGKNTLEGNDTIPRSCPEETIFFLKSFIDLSLRTASGTIIAALEYGLLFFRAFRICNIATALPFLISGSYNELCSLVTSMLNGILEITILYLSETGFIKLSCCIILLWPSPERIIFIFAILAVSDISPPQ